MPAVARHLLALLVAGILASIGASAACAAARGPVPVSRLLGPLAAYRAYATGRLRSLSGDVTRLSASLTAGTGPAAITRDRADWLRARLAWLSLGEDDGAYGAFGSLGRAIDGTAASLPGGARSPAFTGLLRIEGELWARPARIDAARRDTVTLARLVAQLRATPLTLDLPSTPAGVAAWVLRPHEILEDGLRDSLSGRDDAGPTGPAALLGDLAATRELLHLLGPSIAARAPQLLPSARRELAAVDAAVWASRRHGHWVAVAQLDRPARERLDGTVGAALETLARVPLLLSPAGVST